MYQEPNAQLRGFAGECRQLFNSFVEQGFDAEESFYLLSLYVEKYLDHALGREL